MSALPKYFGVVHCGPSEALIVSGVGYGDQPLIICGGRAIVFPCLQKVQRLSLNIMTLTVYSPRVYTVQGVPISVHGIAQVKISGSNDEMLRSAAEQFGDKQPEEIVHIITETLEGHQREIMAHMTVEEIYRDRKTFSSKVFQVSSSDLVNMGIVVISYTIHDIKDEVGYLKSLGKARTNEVMRDARIGEAEAKMATEIATAEAELQRMEAKLKNETGVAKAQRDFDIKKAQYDVEVNTARAEAEKAYQLQAASIQQRIQEQNTQVEIVERAKQIEIQEQEIARKEKELQARIKKPAEAEKYRLEKIAEAERIQEILKAEADAEARVMKGEAEAYALELTAKAEAEESMAKKADAWNDFGKAAIVAETLKVIPTVMKEINHPLTWGQLSSIKVVNNCNGEAGASKVTEDSINIASQLPKLVRALTGVDMEQTMLAID